MPLKSLFNGFPPIFDSIKTNLKNDASSINLISYSCSDPGNSIDLPKLIDWEDSSFHAFGYTENQSFTISFNGFYASLVGYGMRPYESDHALKHWKVFGSNDQNDWTVIDEREENLCEGHMGQRSENEEYLVCKSHVERYFSINRTRFYKHIKIQQIGMNTMEEYIPTDECAYRFYISSFEIFGFISSAIINMKQSKIFHTSMIQRIHLICIILLLK